MNYQKEKRLRITKDTIGTIVVFYHDAQIKFTDMILKTK